MSNICDFGRTLKTECNLLNFTRNCGINLDDFEDETDTYLCRKRLINVKEEGMTICYHHEQVKYSPKVKDEQGIIL